MSSASGAAGAVSGCVVDFATGASGVGVTPASGAAAGVYTCAGASGVP